MLLVLSVSANDCPKGLVIIIADPRCTIFTINMCSLSRSFGICKDKCTSTVHVKCGLTKMSMH